MCQTMLQMFSQLYRTFVKSSKDDRDILLDKPMDEITNTSKKIAELEGKVAQLQEENKTLLSQLEYNRNKESELQKILGNYDNLLKNVLTEKNTITQQQDETRCHLANLEKAFYDLLQKYERAKVVVQGFQNNETIFRKRIEEYERIMEHLKPKSDGYRKYTLPKIVENNGEITKKSADKCNKKRRLLTTM